MNNSSGIPEEEKRAIVEVALVGLDGVKRVLGALGYRCNFVVDPLGEPD